MGSGVKRIIYNKLEQAISNDQNRAQRFAAAHMAELFRAQFLPGSQVDPGATPAAMILAGLLVQPIPSTFILNVAPGMLGAMLGGVTADDSGLVFGKLEATYSDASFVIGGNVSGAARWDIVECAITKIVILEQESRNIYNPVTELFVPQSVAKVESSRIDFYVRQGTPGNGLPAPIAGRIPLAYVHVPNAAGSNDACTFYDVRPMAEDIVGPRGTGRSRLTGQIVARLLTSGDQRQRAHGSFSGTLDGRAIGGPVVRCSPGTSSDFDFMRLGYAQAGGTEQAADFNSTEPLGTLYAAFPFGLPRWQRYGSAPGARVPNGPKGLLVMSGRAAPLSGVETAPFALPAAYSAGLVSCRLVAVLTSRGGGSQGKFPFRWQDDVTRFDIASEGYLDAPGGLANVDLVPGIDYPANATALYTAVRRSWTGVTPGSTWLQSFEITGSQVGLDEPLNNYNDRQDPAQVVMLATAATPQRMVDADRIPIVLPGVGVTLKVRSDSGPQGGGAAGDTRIYVTAWET